MLEVAVSYEQSKEDARAEAASWFSSDHLPINIGERKAVR